MGVWLILLGVVLALLFHRKVYQPIQYWKKRKVPCDVPVPFVGNLLQSLLKRKSMNQVMTDAYNKYSKHRYIGFHCFGTPTLFIRDVELAKQITIKDFDSFSDHRLFVPKGVDNLWDKLTFIRTGSDWQEHRRIVTPAFTLSKLKVMFPNLAKSTNRLIQSILEHNKTVSGNIRPMVMKLANDFTLDYFMGIECDSFKDPNNEFLRMARKTFSMPKIKGFLFFNAAYNSAVAKILGIKFFETEGKLFYRKLIKDALEYRQKHNITRIDMLHLLHESLLENKKDVNNRKDSNELTDEIVAQLMGMYFSNFDTFSITMCNFIYELALQPEVQEKLIVEIDETWRSCDGKLTHDILMQMKYLDMVYKECSRLRSNTTFVDRIVTKPYTIQPVLPHEKPLHLATGQDITIPLYCFMRDEKYFPNPLKFDPERFNEENKAKVDQRAFLPFSSGPRKCIAARLISLEIRLMLFHFLLRFRFVPTEKTVIPFVESKRHNIMSSEYDYWIGLEPRQDVDQSYFH
ncbi:hypothetical protein PPYR_13844 [Photinus pyralis]|uniref:Cytochrome P450 n=1 Tax=Photinus pyralis TaxID=7054 RepID=A0A1Y1LE45_PHOPY|nr:cytochrome P450 9e2-like [Photinus pyralis]XP_031355511.1 cytochrome P450 9e2-like [Photinus pyralis]KAB0794224.1 hypothetical protein PPYR_13844 [Photinus pyralis]